MNSYKLETLDGQPIEGEFHTRRLRAFTPREGMELAAQQKELEAGRIEELEADNTAGPEKGFPEWESDEDADLEENEKAGSDSDESLVE